MSLRFASEQLSDIRHDAQLQLLQAGEATRDARVIAYSGSPSFNDSPTRTLFAAVLTKPSTPGAVAATVQHVVANRAELAFAPSSCRPRIRVPWI